MLSLLAACHQESLDDFQDQAQPVITQLVTELREIRSRDDLVQHQHALERIFDQLVDVIINAEQFKDSHPEAVRTFAGDNGLSEELRLELNRILHMEGGRDVLEKAQEKAVTRLENAEKQKQ